MQVNLNPAETVTILDGTGSQTTAFSSFVALLLEANRLGIDLNSGWSLAGLGQAVRQAGGNPGLIVTRSGPQITMDYVGPQSFERFDVWVDGASVAQGFGRPTTITLPALPAGTHQVVVAASWAGVVAQDPGNRVSFAYVSDGSGYVQPHPVQVASRSGSGLQSLGGNYFRSVFAIDSYAVLVNPSLQTAFRSGAFTDLEDGFFDCITQPDAASALAWFNAKWARISQICHDYNLKFLCVADDLVRGPGTVNIQRALSDWRPSVISQIVATAQQSGYLRGILMVDEADFFANDASDAQLDQLIAILKSAPGVKLTWPVHNTSATRFTSRSDWFDLYWTTQENRFASGMTRSTTASSMPQIRADLQGAVLGAADSSKPFTLLNGIMGTNNSAGVPGTPPSHVTAQIFLGWCFGAIGVRSYTFDYGLLPENQIGATPAGVGSDRWAAMQASYSLIGQLEQRFGFGSTMVQDTTFDPDVVKTTRGNVTIAINCSEGLRSLGALPVPTYRLLGSTYQTDGWTGNLKPAEVAVWV